MKITHIDCAIVSVPLPRAVVTPIHHITTVDNLLVTLHTDAGIQGISYLWCFGQSRANVLLHMVLDLGQFVIGQDPRMTSVLWSRLWRENNFFGRAGVAMLAQSALDIACWDIKAKAVQQPLWQLLGGIRKPIPVYAGGLFLSDSLDSIVQEACQYKAQGFRAMKMRTGGATASEDIARVEAVRYAIGTDVALMVDVVQGWTPEQAIRMGRSLARFDLSWLEDPIAFDDHAGMRAVAQALDTPLCAGENDYSKLGFARLMEGQCIDIAMADLQRVGGITEWLKVAAIAESRSMRITPHVFHEISVHLMSVVPNGFWMEYVPWWDVLFEEAPALVEGHLTASDRPGLGLAFDWDQVDGMRVR
jgi:L-alanine-DL-glutamate epimerase-like enolase superfamily enzyme